MVIDFDRVKLMPRPILCCLLLLSVATATGCAQTKTLTRSEGNRPPLAGARVLLMPADIELYELTVGGLPEPKADWTASARIHVAAALREELTQRKAALIFYQPPRSDPPKEYAHTQLVKLHDVVGGAILTHQMGMGPSLPTKEGAFDWSLGQGTAVLREDFGADYGLFLFVRDSYAGAGRTAMMALAAAGGVVVPGGRQIGFASLVDLKSGNILWFNWLMSGTGDLRDAEPARSTVRSLLADFPS